jgi:hypothetical protein
MRARPLRRPAQTSPSGAESCRGLDTPLRKTLRVLRARVVLTGRVSFGLKGAAGTGIRNLLVVTPDTTDGMRRTARRANPDVESMLSKELRLTYERECITHASLMPYGAGVPTAVDVCGALRPSTPRATLNYYLT